MFTQRKDYEERFREIEYDFEIVAEHSVNVINYVRIVVNLLEKYDSFEERLMDGIRRGLPFKSRLQEMLAGLKAEAEHHREGLTARV